MPHLVSFSLDYDVDHPLLPGDKVPLRVDVHFSGRQTYLIDIHRMRLLDAQNLVATLLDEPVSLSKLYVSRFKCTSAQSRLLRVP